MLVVLIIALAVVTWLSCSIIAYSFTFGNFQREFPLIAKANYRENRSFAIVWGLVFGPIGLLILFAFDGYKHGMKWR